MHEKKRHGFSHDVATAKHDRIGAFDRDFIAAKNLHTARGSAGDKSPTIAYELAKVDGVEAIDVFGRSDGFKNALGIDLRGQRELDQDAVDIIVVVQVGDEPEHEVGGYVGGWSVKPMGHAELFAGSNLAFDVDVRGGIFADENGCEAGTNTLRLKARDFLFELGKKFVADFQAVERLSGHGKSITCELGEFPRMETKHLLPCAAMEVRYGDYCQGFTGFGI